MKAQFPTIEGLHEKNILSAYAIKCLTGKGVGWIVKVCIFGGCFQTALFYFNFHEKVEKGFYIFSNTGCVFWRTSKNADFFLTIRKKCKNSTQNMLFSLISPLCCDCLDVDCSCQNIESSAKASTTCYFCPTKFEANPELIQLIFWLLWALKARCFIDKILTCYAFQQISKKV